MNRGRGRGRGRGKRREGERMRRNRGSGTCRITLKEESKVIYDDVSARAVF